MVDLLTSLLETLNKHGWVAFVLVSLAVFNCLSVWRAWKREDKQIKRIDTLNDELRVNVVPLVTRCEQTINVAVRCIEQNSRVLERMITDHERR